MKQKFLTLSSDLSSPCCVNVGHLFSSFRFEDENGDHAHTLLRGSKG